MKESDEKRHDTPETYAVEYLESEEHIALFEKIKLIHDECQSKNLKCLLLVESPTRKERQICLFHIHNKEGEQPESWKRFQELVFWMDGFLKFMAKGYFFIARIKHNDENKSGEEWKNEK